jgi:hypothetical protein
LGKIRQRGLEQRRGMHFSANITRILKFFKRANFTVDIAHQNSVFNWVLRCTMYFSCATPKNRRARLIFQVIDAFTLKSGRATPLDPRKIPISKKSYVKLRLDPVTIGSVSGATTINLNI